jgi:hypothetical protein
MPFIGNQPALSYTSFAKQDFTTSATTSYALSQPVANENEIALFINFVRQEPTTAYTASGTSLTLTSATSASDDMYAIFLGKAVQTVNPPAGSVGASQIADGSIALGKLSATGTKDSTTFLRGDNTFASAGSPSIVDNGNATAISINSSEVVRLPVGILRLQNATTGTADTDGLLLEVSGNDVYINNKESASIYFRTNNTDRMRIDSSGDLIVGTYNNPATTNFVKASASGIIQSGRTGTGSQPQAEFFNGNGVVGSIYTSGSSTAYNTSSDYRLKENVSYDFDATTRLKQLKPARFNFIADADTTVDGFLAHEVSSVVPEAISGTHNATETKEKVVVNANGNVIAQNIEQADWETGKIADENGNTQYPTDSTWEATKVVPVYQGIDQSKLVPLLVKTIQELEARITALENN